jgi:hypothetical protein
MQRSPEDRFQTTLEFADAFTHAAANGSGERGDTRRFGKLFGR